MNLQEYQFASKRTMTSLGSEKLNLSHCVLGLTSEMEELYGAIEKEDYVNAAEELTDILFYLVNYITFRGINILEVENNNIGVTKYGILQISTLSDLVKKYIAYDKAINVEKEFEVVCFIYNFIKDSFDEIGKDIGQAMQNNVDKLIVRFPLDEGFTKEKANNRNLEAERIELEK